MWISLYFLLILLANLFILFERDFCGGSYTYSNNARARFNKLSCIKLSTT